MPLNSIPPTVDVPALIAKRAAAAGKSSVDVAFWGGLIPGSEDNLSSLAAEGVCGFKSFMVDSGVPEFPPMNKERLAHALPVLGRLGLPSLIHAEDPALLLSLVGDPREYATYLASRPPDAEAAAIELVSRLAGGSGAAVHILHISSADAVEALTAGPSSMSGETCPHYLTFCAEEVPPGSTPFKCAPPIRSAEHREALWEALLSGKLEMVVSDHSPAPADVKDLEGGDFGRAWGGIGSLQLRLQATWTGGGCRGATLGQLSRWLVAEPALSPVSTTERVDAEGMMPNGGCGPEGQTT